MRNLRSFVPIVAAAGCAAIFTGCASSGTTAQGGMAAAEGSRWWHEGEAVVKNIEGQADVSVDGQTWETLRGGQVVEQGSRIRTGPSSTVRLDLGDHSGGIVKVMPESLVEFEQLGAANIDSDVLAVFNLPQGRVVGDTLKMPANKKITVKTPAGGYEIK